MRTYVVDIYMNDLSYASISLFSFTNVNLSSGAILVLHCSEVADLLA